MGGDVSHELQARVLPRGYSLACKPAFSALDKKTTRGLKCLRVRYCFASDGVYTGSSLCDRTVWTSGESTQVAVLCMRW
jgi:hypothetical protein